ncbi:hypothetical protein X737_30530 [Mesorhizobium sp. L48C026A00]|nr:hypothetical protein X737_30530 [Mesorhizobium sp. L48C026A00]
MENSQTILGVVGSSVKTTLNWAKSTCACSPGGVSKRTSYPRSAAAGRTSRRKSVTDSRRGRLIGKDDIELGEVDLRLLAGRGLEANLVSTLRRGRTDVAQEVGDGRVAAAIAEVLQFPEKPAAGGSGIA